MQQTSIDSYYQARDEGLFSRTQMDVVRLYFSRGVMSQNDVCRILGETRRKRVHELERAGVLRCVGTKQDAVTHRTVRVYALTGKMPNEQAASITQQELF